MTGFEIPPEGNGFALEEDEEAVGNCEDYVEDHDETDYPDVGGDGGDAEEEESNAEFQDAGC